MDFNKMKYKNISIIQDFTLLQALKKMDSLNRKLLIITNNKKFIGLLSIGDIQRAILKNFPFDTKVSKILRKDIRVASPEDSFEMIKKMMLDHRMEFCPVVSSENEILNVYFWEDVFGDKVKRYQNKLNLPVVIMAGGKGTRMKPLTSVIPKPLIPIGDNTIIEEVMNRFVDVGCNDFYLSVNYKSETIKHYFNQLNNKNYHINYFKEDKPLGTAGSLYLIKDKIKTTFFVSNCDIIINEDYSEILKYHKENGNELTIVSALKHYPIPYGILETKKNGILTALIEKPNLTFQINSGMYILEPHLLKEIPENEFFHITHLIENVRKRNGKVGVFPMSEGSWKDVGDWDEYLKTIK